MACNKNAARLAFLKANHEAKDATIEELAKHGNINYQLPSNPKSKSASSADNLDGCSALHIAVKLEDLKSMKMLLKNGADISKKDAQGMTALHHAVECQRNSIGSFIHKLRGPLKDAAINLLLCAHMDLKLIENPCSKNGISHLYAACITNNVEAVEYFLKNGASANEAVDAHSRILPGYTPLHFAARYCSAEVAKILLEHGAQPHTKDVEGLTPLHMLIQRNMDIADWMNMGKRARCGYLQKEYNSNESMIKAILEKATEEIIDDEGLSRLHVACTLKDTSIFEKILEETTDIEQSVKHTSRLWSGYTALHFAAHFNAEAVKILMNRGANMLIRAIDSFTPLDLCLQRYKAEVVYDLIDSQVAWKNILFSDGRTKLLDFIYSMKNIDEFKYLLEDSVRNIDTFIPHNSAILPGYTPLHLVTVSPGRSKRIELLLENTLYMTKVDESEIYNCDKQEYKLYVERIEACLNRTPDLTIQDFNLSTAIHLAFKLQRENVVKVLTEKHSEIQSTVKVDRIGEDGLSHFEIACIAGVKNLVEYLFREHKIHYVLPINYEYTLNGRPIIFNAGSTCLHIAVVIQNVKLIKYLLTKGFDIYSWDCHGMTPIHLAMKTSPEVCNAMFQWMLENTLEERVANCGLSHLHVACMAGNEKAVQALVKNGTDLNAVYYIEGYSYEKNSSNSWTPLQIAVNGLHRNIVKILIQAGAKIFVEPNHLFNDLYDHYPDLFFEALEGNVAKDKGPVDEDHTLKELHAACFSIDVQRVKKLLDNGADPNARVHSSNPIWGNYTPLHVLATEYKRRRAMTHSANAIVKMMIKHGADVTFMNDYNETPLHVAFNGISQKDDLEQKICVARAFESWDGMPMPERLEALLKMPPADDETQLQHAWNNKDRSLNLNLKEDDPLTLHRRPVAQSTDSIRGKVGYTKGLHVWEIHWSIGQRGTHCVVGVATAKAPLHSIGYQNLLGSTEESCGWDLGRNHVYQVLRKGSHEYYAYPRYMEQKPGAFMVVPDKIKVILDMDEGTLAFMIDDKYLGVAYEGLKGKTMHPSVSVVWGHAEVTMKYIGGIEDDEQSKANSLSTLNALLTDYNDFYINPTNDKGISAFHIACLCNNLPVVEKFLQNGVNVNRPIDHFCNTYAGYTPIHLAAYYKHTATVDLLIEYGADIHVRNRDGNTPLHCAADYSDNWSCKRSDEESNVDVSASLIEAGADVKTKNRFDQMPIEILMETKGLTNKTAEIFLANQANVNIFNRFDVGFIATAISGESTLEGVLENPIYELVVNHPEDNVEDDMGRTPTHNIVALKRSYQKVFLTTQIYLEAIEGLTKLNFDIDQYDHEGRTPLHYAVKFENLEAICALLNLGADFNIVDIDGETPYSLAVKLIRDGLLPCDEERYTRIIMTFVHHLYKMKLAGMDVSDVNEEANEIVKYQFVELDCEVDLQKLENVKIGKCDFSLREFLLRENAETFYVIFYENMDEETRESFDELFEISNKKLATEYPEFVGILRMQYRKVRAQTTLSTVKEGNNSSLFSSLYSYLSWS